MEERPSYYSILTADVRYDENLTPNEKLLFSEITALLQKSGVCWASNQYFANLYNVTKKSISTWINHLYELGYICVQVTRDALTKQVLERTITLPSMEKIFHTPMEENFHTPMEENVKDNNTSNNNTSINIKKNTKKESFIPPTKQEVIDYATERNRLDLADRFYDYFNVGKWIDAKGNKVKNWKQKFITWENNNGQFKSVSRETKKSNFGNREYKDGELNSLFDSLDEVEI